MIKACNKQFATILLASIKGHKRSECKKCIMKIVISVFSSLLSSIFVYKKMQKVYYQDILALHVKMPYYITIIV